jgi:hypothetical protein
MGSFVWIYVHLQIEKEYTDLSQTWHVYPCTPRRENMKIQTSGPSSSETTTDRRKAPGTKLFCLRAITGNEVANQKLSWVRVSWKVLSLEMMTIIIIYKTFNSMYRMIRPTVSLIRPTVSFQAIKTDNKYKHFSNFFAVKTAGGLLDSL